MEVAVGKDVYIFAIGEVSNMFYNLLPKIVNTHNIQGSVLRGRLISQQDMGLKNVFTYSTLSSHTYGSVVLTYLTP
jgi:hypothetical protein